MSKATFVLISATVLLFSWSNAYAYIDAGTGSMILQIVLGGVAGALVLVKLYWHRFKTFLGLKTKEPTDS